MPLFFPRPLGCGDVYLGVALPCDVTRSPGEVARRGPPGLTVPRRAKSLGVAPRATGRGFFPHLFFVGLFAERSGDVASSGERPIRVSAEIKDVFFACSNKDYCSSVLWLEGEARNPFPLFSRLLRLARGGLSCKHILRLPAFWPSSGVLHFRAYF